MDRIGRITELGSHGTTVEVGLNEECVSGSCSDCHAAAAGTWVFTVPRARFHFLGQRVLVRERRGLFRILEWLTFLVCFCAVLAIGQALVEAARVGATFEQRVMVLVGVAVGVAGAFATRAWARTQPKFRIKPLDSPSTPNAGNFVSIEELHRSDG